MSDSPQERAVAPRQELPLVDGGVQRLMSTCRMLERQGVLRPGDTDFIDGTFTIAHRAALTPAPAAPSEAPQAEAWGQEPSAFMVRRDYMGGGYTEWLCKTRGDAEEMAKDAVSLPNPDKIIPLYRAGQGRDAAREALTDEQIDDMAQDELSLEATSGGNWYVDGATLSRDSVRCFARALAAIEPCKT